MTDAFAGPWAESLTAFVAFKRSLGFKYVTEARILQRFDRWTGLAPADRAALTPAVVEAWLVRGPREGDKTQRHRLGVLRHVALYLTTQGGAAHIPEPQAATRHYTFVPHIFTAHEIQQIFTEADRLVPHRRSTVPLVLPVLFRVLYGCGLRISEALQLTLPDGDPAAQTLTIRASKFGKDRGVPRAPSLATVVGTDVATVHAAAPPSARLFGDRDGGPLPSDRVYRRFRDILWYAGIPHRGKGHGPRVHDLRHTFAVPALKAAVDRDVDLQAVLPVLSAYLGHASLAATEQYRRLTADAFPALRATLDHATGWVIPEGAWE